VSNSKANTCVVGQKTHLKNGENLICMKRDESLSNFQISVKITREEEEIQLGFLVGNIQETDAKVVFHCSDTVRGRNMCFLDGVFEVVIDFTVNPFTNLFVNHKFIALAIFIGEHKKFSP